MTAATLVGGSAGTAVVWWITRRQILGLLDDKPGLLGEHTIGLSADGIRERTAVNDSLTAWHGVRRIVEDRAHIYLFIGPQMAHVVPKRAFRSAADAQRFLEEATALWQQYGAGA